VQALHEPPSSRHSNVEPPSVEVKENEAPVALVGSAGCAVIDVFGGALSRVTVYDVAASVLLALSIARTRKT
jgi:hypothetical protein